MKQIHEFSFLTHNSVLLTWLSLFVLCSASGRRKVVDDLIMLPSTELIYYLDFYLGASIVGSASARSRGTKNLIFLDSWVLPAELDWVGHRIQQQFAGKSFLACKGNTQYKPLVLLEPKSSGSLVWVDFLVPDWILPTFVMFTTSFQGCSVQGSGCLVALPLLT